MKHAVVIPLTHSPETALRALVQPLFHLDKWRRMGALGCELIDDGAEGEIRLRRRARQGAAPAPLSKLVPSEVTFLNLDRWNPARKTGEVEVKLDGLPLRMHATTKVVPTAQGCELRFDWDIQASVPLLGGAMEKFVAKNVDRETLEEAKVVNALLATYA